MSDTKHTPGPWKVSERVKTARLDNALMVRPVDDCNHEHGATAIIATSEANAILIAAAPDLLKTLEAVKAWDISNLSLDLPHEIRVQIQAALAKATGCAA